MKISRPKQILQVEAGSPETELLEPSKLSEEQQEQLRQLASVVLDIFLSLTKEQRAEYSQIFGQHIFWALGRGLGDARGRGKTILRLKVVLEESGWTLAPGTTLRNIPRATSDRLYTAVSLMKQAGLFPSVSLGLIDKV